MNNKEFLEWNNKMCEKYNPHLFHEESNFLIKFVEKIRKNIILKFVDAQKKDVILELGCGACNILKELQNGKILGLDISSFILKYAQTKNKIKNVLLMSSAENVCIKNNSIDKIICSEVLEHTLSPDSVILESARLLKSDGFFVVSIPNEKLINKIKNVLLKLDVFNLFNKICKYKMSEKMEDEWHLHIFEPRRFEENIKKYYKILKKECAPFNFLPVRIVYLCQKN